MRLKVSFVFILLFGFNAFAQNIQSPDGKLSLSFALTGEGEPTHQLSYGGRPVVQKSKLGIELKDQPAFAKGFNIVNADI
ncbi:MAG: glycoside hydrolase family 97 N-terminal domain-containing protein, partial [Pyrinomonadaceae bacterium]